jgi:hypothetical protein
MGTISTRFSGLLILCVVILVGNYSWAQEPQPKTNPTENKMGKAEADSYMLKKQNRVEVKQKKVEKAKLTKQAQEKKEQLEAEVVKTGKAKVKNKGELQGKEFGQSMGEQDKLKAEKPKMAAEKAATEAQKAERAIKQPKQVKKK